MLQFPVKLTIISHKSKTKLNFLNRLREPFLASIGMAEANLKESCSLRLLGLTFYTDMKWKDYIESVCKSAKNDG